MEEFISKSLALLSLERESELSKGEAFYSAHIQQSKLFEARGICLRRLKVSCWCMQVLRIRLNDIKGHAQLPLWSGCHCMNDGQCQKVSGHLLSLGLIVTYMYLLQ